MRALINASINITKTKDSRILKKKKKKKERKPQKLTIFLAVIIVLIFKIINLSFYPGSRLHEFIGKLIYTIVEQF